MLALLASTVLLSGHFQEPVVGVADAERLFTSPNQRLNTNKQAAYHIMKDLLEANHWELADKYLTERYLQHNPNAASGRQGVVDYFTKVLKRTPTPIPTKMKTPIVAVIAEGDYVCVVTPRTLAHPSESGRTYTTSWFDLWRFKGGKADEHWDGAELPQPAHGA